MMDEVVLELDEFEALRLADHESMYQEEAAKQMGISRQTFGRIIESAHRKIADALVNGKAIKISTSTRDENEIVKVKTNSIQNEDSNSNKRR